MKLISLKKKVLGTKSCTMPSIPTYMFPIQTSHQLEKNNQPHKADYILLLTAL